MSLWISGNVVEEGNARRQHRKTQPAPKHTRAAHSEAYLGGGERHQPLPLTTGEKGEVLWAVKSVLQPYLSLPTPPNIRNAHSAVLHSG